MRIKKVQKIKLNKPKKYRISWGFNPTTRVTKTKKDIQNKAEEKFIKEWLEDTKNDY